MLTSLETQDGEEGKKPQEKIHSYPADSEWLLLKVYKKERMEIKIDSRSELAANTTLLMISIIGLALIDSISMPLYAYFYRNIYNLGIYKFYKSEV